MRPRRLSGFGSGGDSSPAGEEGGRAGWFHTSLGLSGPGPVEQTHGARLFAPCFGLDAVRLVAVSCISRTVEHPISHEPAA
jgi:hypothetical protein